MSYETVEAVQCRLSGGPLSGKVILVPGTPEDPPKTITDEYLVRENPRAFEGVNEHGPWFYFNYDLSLNAYVKEEA
jgi:hypothetical protein